MLVVVAIVAGQHLTVDQRLSGRMKGGRREALIAGFMSGFVVSAVAGRPIAFVAGGRVAGFLRRFSLHRQRPWVGRLGVAVVRHHGRRAGFVGWQADLERSGCW